jgi:hypothetical protein
MRSTVDSRLVAHRSRQTPSQPCRYSIRPYSPPLIGQFQRFLGDHSLVTLRTKGNLGPRRWFYMSVSLHLLFRTVFRRLLVLNHKPRSSPTESPALLVISRHGFLIVPYLRIVSASLHLLKCRTPLLLAEHMGAFNLLINTSGSQNEQRTLRTPFYPSFSIGKAFGPTFWRRMSRISLRKAWY